MMAPGLPSDDDEFEDYEMDPALGMHIIQISGPIAERLMELCAATQLNVREVLADALSEYETRRIPMRDRKLTGGIWGLN